MIRRKTASRAEKKERIEGQRTQGKKGCAMPRVNLTMTPVNKRYLKIMSQITGSTMSEFVNDVLNRYRDKYPDAYKQAAAILAIQKGGQTDEIE